MEDRVVAGGVVACAGEELDQHRCRAAAVVEDAAQVVGVAAEHCDRAVEHCHVAGILDRVSVSEVAAFLGGGREVPLRWHEDEITPRAMVEFTTV